MKLGQLRALVAIEREGTVSAAAQALNTSQPAVSRAIRSLEADLGQRLFDRTRNSVSFNEAGRLALVHAHTILADEQRMRDAFDELSRRQRTLRVWSEAPAPTWKLARLVANGLPGVILETELRDGSAIERALLNAEIDLAIARTPLPLPGIGSIAFMTEDLSIAVPKDHPFAQRPSVSFGDVDGETMLVLEQVGFWLDVVRRRMPNSRLILQSDTRVFAQLFQSTDLLGFSTNVEENELIAGTRATVPLTDAEAHATFFLCVRKDAGDQTQAVFELAKSNEAGTPAT